MLTDLDHIRYATGFTGSHGTVLITADKAILVTDGRYTLQATDEAPDFEIREFPGDPMEATIGIINNEIKPSNLGFESDYINFTTYLGLSEMINDKTELVPTRRIVEDLKIVKDSEEIEYTRRAVEISDKCMEHLVNYIKPGMTERQVALEITTFKYNLGDETMSSWIVASGPHAAYPHLKPTDRVIQTGEMVKLDFGAIVNNYGSDITRTFFVGEPTEKFREIYGIVLEAQLKAIAAIKAGKLGKEIDAVARDFITSKGYGEYFIHNLGHNMPRTDGPGFTPTSETVLAPGMIITVEPGIYIPGWGGVRIEDDIVVTDDGCIILNKFTKEIITVG